MLRELAQLVDRGADLALTATEWLVGFSKRDPFALEKRIGQCLGKTRSATLLLPELEKTPPDNTVQLDRRQGITQPLKLLGRLFDQNLQRRRRTL